MKKPSIILADEPTGNLDTATGENILNLLVSQCREFNTTLIMVSHALNTCRFATRIINMEDGILTEDRSSEGCQP